MYTNNVYRYLKTAFASLIVALSRGVNDNEKCLAIGLILIIRHDLFAHTATLSQRALALDTFKYICI